MLQRFLKCDPLLYQQLMLLAGACRNFHVQTLSEEGSPCSADHAICVLHGPMAGATSHLGYCSNVPSDLSLLKVRFRGTLRHSHGQKQSEPSTALHILSPKHPGGWRCKLHCRPQQLAQILCGNWEFRYEHKYETAE